MKKAIQLLILWIGILISACQTEEKFLVFEPLVVKDTLYLEGTVLCDSLLMALITDIDFTDSCIMVLSYSDDHFLHCFDKQNGQLRGHFLPEGRGPGELISVKSLNINHESGTLICLDGMKRNRHEYNIDSLLGKKDYTGKTFPMQRTLRDILPLKGTFLAGPGIAMDEQEHFYRMYLTTDDSPSGRYSNYPFWRNSQELDLALLCCYTSMRAAAPDGERFVTTTFLGAIMEIFTLTDTTIHRKKARGFIKPQYGIIKNQIYPVPGTIWGFHDVYATNRYIYTLYSGNTQGIKGPVDIAVFDWEGNLVRYYRTGYRLERLCVDESRHEIYAAGVGTDLETVVFKFRLKE